MNPHVRSFSTPQRISINPSIIWYQVVVDNYADNAYHVPYAHKALGSNLDLGSYQATLHDGFSIQVFIYTRRGSLASW